MCDEFSSRLANAILESNRNLGSFEIDFMDEQTNAAVSRCLERMGCTIERSPFKSALLVVCPQEIGVASDDGTRKAAAPHT
jgi:hypothetical protein